VKNELKLSHQIWCTR